VLNQFIN